MISNYQIDYLKRVKIVADRIHQEAKDVSLTQGYGKDPKAEQLFAKGAELAYQLILMTRKPRAETKKDSIEREF